MEEKYLKVKKAFKDIEINYNREFSQIEKDKAIYLEKITNLESEK